MNNEELKKLAVQLNAAAGEPPTYRPELPSPDLRTADDLAKKIREDDQKKVQKSSNKW